jgi:hypothetical protein
MWRPTAFCAAESRWSFCAAPAKHEDQRREVLLKQNAVKHNRQSSLLVFVIYRLGFAVKRQTQRILGIKEILNIQGPFLRYFFSIPPQPNF